MSENTDTALQTGHATQGTLQAMSREVVEAKGMVAAAKEFPRNEDAAFVRLMKSCQRASFAGIAEYSFPRGGAKVVGPSVNLAREAARCWGNVTYGVRVIAEDKESIHIQGWAWDMETNVRHAAEDKFAKLIQRKDKRTGETKWIEPDERDLRELVNRRGAMCERNALLKILPRDLIEDAQATSRGTLSSASKSDLAKDPKATTKALVMSFDVMGVNVAMLEIHLGHKLDLIDAEELAELRRIYRSIADGHTSRKDHFDVGEKTTSAAGAFNAELDGASEAAQEDAAPVDDYSDLSDEEADKQAELDAWAREGKAQ